MKKTLRRGKLRLDTETLRRLTSLQLAGVAGALMRRTDDQHVCSVGSYDPQQACPATMHECPTYDPVCPTYAATCVCTQGCGGGPTGAICA